MVRRGAGAPRWKYHSGDILLSFVNEGEVTIDGQGNESFQLEYGDAFMMPPRMKTCYSDPAVDVELVEVALLGRSKPRSSTDPHDAPCAPEITGPSGSECRASDFLFDAKSNSCPNSCIALFAAARCRDQGRLINVARR